MAAGIAVWGIDIGQCALKALKLRNAGDGKVEAVAFDLIEHPKILSQPDADADELIRGALEKFASRNDWQGDQFVIGVPGQQTFARFCKMPPVDQKKIPDLVRFEASQQIPFDIDDVVWDYQTFSAGDSPELEVGIFAMRKDLIRKQIDYFSKVGIAPSIVQTIPSALYNYCRFDVPEAQEKGGAMVVINVGSQNTDLVIVEPNSAWNRNIPLGGNSFTEALVRSFKLSFPKAENLKRTAATSKYARQIFQAMRPVFAELVAEIQRSIGFYSSTHREVELKRVLALGNAFRLPGLQKYLENNLTISGGVLRPEKFNRVLPSATINAPQFTENILTFAGAYGLALQGLGLAQINATLLPGELARIAVWKKKRPYFIAAAACLGLAAILPYTRNFLDQQALASTQADDAQRVTRRIIDETAKLRDDYNKVKTNTGESERQITQLLELQKDKRLVPQLLALIYEAMPEPDKALAGVQTADQLREAVKSGQVPRTKRRQLLIDAVTVQYVNDVSSFEMPVPGTGAGGAGPRSPGGVSGYPGAPGPTVAGMRGGPRGMRIGEEVGLGEGPKGAIAAGKAGEAGFYVSVTGRLLYGESQGEADSFLTEEYERNLREFAAQPGRGFYIPDDDPKNKGKVSIVHAPPTKRQAIAGPTKNSPTGALNINPGGPGGAGSGLEDPITQEPMGGDWVVDFGFKVKVGEKPKPPAQPAANKPGK
jgi:type IV pilus assembly protein PilM